jgi:hypothetical protein
MLAGCASVKVSFDHDPNANFSGLETYAGVSSTQPKTGDARLDGDILNSKIRQAVENQLRLKGYQKATDGSPDFLIAYMTSISKN